MLCVAEDRRQRIGRSRTQTTDKHRERRLPLLIGNRAPHQPAPQDLQIHRSLTPALLSALPASFGQPADHDP
jgi:hypothetical protein